MLFAGRLLRNELPLIMKKSSKLVSPAELLVESTKAPLELGDEVDTN